MASKSKELLDSAAAVDKLKRIASRRTLNRRNFMTALGVTGAATGAALVAKNAVRPARVEAAAPSQIDVLNFALNLEYLEATYYSYVTTGGDLPSAITVGSGPVYNYPAKVTFPNQQITDLINEIYYDEISHVQALRNLLGASAIGRPTLDLAGTNKSSGGSATVTAAAALSLLRVFEDVGVTAYAGAAPLLSGSNLTYASQILAVEGFHAGALRLLSIQQATPYAPTYSFTFKANTTSGSTSINTATTLAFVQVGQVISGPGIPKGATVTSFDPVGLTLSISAAATATGSQVSLVTYDAADVAPGDLGTAALASAGPANIAGTTVQYTGFFATSGSTTSTGSVPPGVAFARSTSQVLSIVLATSGAAPNPGVANGGFFPKGFNGIITSI
jgi:hypothetical protein